MTSHAQIDRLIEDTLQGSQLAVAKLITLVENRTRYADYIMKRVFPRSGNAKIVGITGPGGAGKQQAREHDK